MGDLVEEIKFVYTCKMILQNYVVLRTSGSRFYVCHCPFCQADAPAKAKPRFWINVDLDVCNCFVPACRQPKPMDVINLYAMLNHLSNSDAIRALSAMLRLRPN